MTGPLTPHPARTIAWLVDSLTHLEHHRWS